MSGIGGMFADEVAKETIDFGQVGCSLRKFCALTFSSHLARTIEASQTVVPRFCELGSCASLSVFLYTKEYLR